MKKYARLTRSWLNPNLMKPNRLLFFLPDRAPKLEGRGLWIALLLAVLIMAGGYAAVSGWYSSQLEPASPSDRKMVLIKVKSGVTTGDIAEELAAKRLIKNRTAFLFAAKSAGLDKSLQAGEYFLSRSMNVRQIIETMAKGATADVQITIPEGYTVEQIAILLEEKGLARKDRFLSLAKDFAPFDTVKSRPGVNYRAEGFLFPDTYRINRNATEEEILNLLAKEFAKKFTPELQEQAKASGLSPYDVIVLASLIEREVQLAKERPMVARVFLNRLQIDMPLQSCATIQYILGYPKEELTIADTQLPSPYNTYLNSGMPPGPVANPGISSIKAALNPAEGDWLYFVVDGKTGGHRFSRTLAEHEAAIGQIGK